MRYWLVATATVLYFFLHQTVYAKQPPGGAVQLGAVELDAQGMHATVTVSAMGAAEPSLQVLDTGAVLPTQAQPSAIDLWLLLDSSAPCSRFQMDQRVTAWLGKLRQQLPASSRVSVVSFHRGSLEVIALRQAPTAITGLRIQCHPKAVSAEPQRAIERLLQSPAPRDMPRAVWVLSSGNLSVQADSLDKLRESQTHLSVLLYNPALRQALSPVMDAFRSRMGDLLYDGTGDPLTDSLPARWYRASAAIPSDWTQPSLSLVAVAKAGGKTTKSPLRTLEVGQWTHAQLSPWLTRTLWVGLALLVCLLIYRGVRAYLPRHCVRCKHRLRTRDITCSFCFETQGAYLVAQNPLGSGTTAPHPLVVGIDADYTELGSHRKSRLRLLRSQSRRRRAYFAIHRQAGDYRITPLATAPVFINSVPVHSPRYLACGDKIVVGKNRLVFVKQGRQQYVQAKIR